MYFNSWYAAAAGVALITAFLHTVGGGRSIARPLLRGTELDPVVRDLLYYCWHLVTIVVLGMAIVLVLATLGRSSADLTLAAIILAAIFSLWNVGLMLYRKHRIRDMPQWLIFGPIAVFGAVGYLVG